MQSYVPLISDRTWLPAWTELRREFVKDWPLHAGAGLYLIATCGVAVALGSPTKLIILVYVPLWVFAALYCVVLYVLVVKLPKAIRAGSKRPLTDALRAAYRETSPVRLIAGLVLICVTSLYWGVFTSAKNMLPFLAPVWLDRQIADFGLLIHGGYSPWRVLHPLLGHQAITRVIERIYLDGWTLLLTGISTLIALHPSLERLRVRYFATMFLVLVVLGNVVAGIGMSAGPVFYGHVMGDYERFGELVNYLAFSKGLTNSAADIQDYLWSNFLNGEAQLGTGISAFPSIHVAMATLFVMAGWSLGRRLGMALLAFWLMIVLGSVHLGWHYSADGYASAAGTIVLWQIVGWVQNRLALRSRLAPGSALEPSAV